MNQTPGRIDRSPRTPLIGQMLRAAGAASFKPEQGLWRNRDGAAAVEFALLLPVLVLLLAGLIDMSRLASQTMQVRAAAQAGVDYAQRRGWNQEGIAEAVRTATLSGAIPFPAPQSVVGCMSAGAVVADAGATCPAGGKPGRFITVAAQAPFKALLPGPHQLMLPATLFSQALVRAE